MTEKPEASVLTARRAAQHFRLSSADDACEHLYILTVRSSLGPSPPNAGRYTVASRLRCCSCERGYIFPRAPEQFVTSPLCLVGYVRWDARSDRVPPLQTIIHFQQLSRSHSGKPTFRPSETVAVTNAHLVRLLTTALLESQRDFTFPVCAFFVEVKCAPWRPVPRKIYAVRWRELVSITLCLGLSLRPEPARRCVIGLPAPAQPGHRLFAKQLMDQG